MQYVSSVMKCVGDVLYGVDGSTWNFFIFA